RRSSYLIDVVYQILSLNDLFPIVRDAVLIFGFLSLLSFAFYFFSLTQKKNTEIPKTAKLNNKPESTLKTDDTPNSIEESSSLSGQTTIESSQGQRVSIEQCLFSPTSGLGWQDHLEKRLTLELERAAYNEQDLSLILFQVPGVKKSSDIYRSLAKSVQISLSFEDLVFEYGEEGMAIVIPNSSLEQTLDTLKGFLKNLDPSLRKNLPVPRCGISSRNGRLLEGKQLLLEATGALSKAGNTWKDCIVGFRSDPGKYREYVSKRESSKPID
ncbi:MAG: hypothetical protein SNJ78_12125, partial [Spirochaetales bacterium]